MQFFEFTENFKVVQDRQKEVSDEDKYKNELAAIEEKSKSIFQSNMHVKLI